jgi:hypothetical protein
MATGSADFERRDEALEVVRQGLRKIEIETRRVKANLARLEADLNDAAADELSRTACAAGPGLVSSELRFDPPQPAPFIAPHGNSTVSRASPIAPPVAVGVTQETDAKPRVAHHPIAPLRAASSVRGPAPRARSELRNEAQAYRRTASPIVLSAAVHVVGLLLSLMFGFTTLLQQPAMLFASPSDLSEDVPAEFAEVRIEPTKFDDLELQNVVSDTDDFNLADDLLAELEAAQIGAGSQPLGDVGQLDALPSELGTLMTGAGSPARGRPGGELGDAVFFGTRSQGNRFVFIVDNSSSMKGGRLEAAITELLRTVGSLLPRQAFYVIFVSDQTYPMFYPQPAAELVSATAPNKKRLAAWLPNAVLASGKNRELIKAMDLAASLRPDVVYLLWDGDMRYSDKVRTDVMTHLTRPQPWNFAIHTLGMGITSLDAEYNLTAIAKAHGGTYRRIEVPPGRRQ